MKKLSKGTEIVQNTLDTLGYKNEVIELSDSTRTAQEAADTLGCKVAQIAKTIVFKLEETNQALVVIASGSNRINEMHLSEILGQTLGKADASFVREETGYVIGGVSPIIQDKTIKIILDEDLFQFENIWAAAGHPKAVFQLTPSELKTLTNGEVMNVKG